MHRKFVDYLADPITKAPLTLEIAEAVGDEIESGLLRSRDRSYPIIRGIPRFVDMQEDNYSKSFGYQWRRWPRIQFESENVGRPMEGHTRRMWERITGVADAALKDADAPVLDMGCGPGRFTDVARSKGVEVIAIDYSGAVEAARKNFRHDSGVCVCQADALNLPIRPNSVSGAFSIGVLHHTPDPCRGVAEAYRTIRGGGWFGISVYGKDGYYDVRMVQFWRRCFKRLWPLLKHRPPLAYTCLTNYLLRPLVRAMPTLARPLRMGFPFVMLPDRRWSILDTFDSVTPSYQSAHECYEVFRWLKDSSFENIEPTNWGFTSFRGTKGRAE